MNPVDSRESAYDSASAEASAAVACVQCRSMSWKAVTPSQTGESACHAACAHILLRVRLNSHDLGNISPLRRYSRLSISTHLTAIVARAVEHVDLYARSFTRLRPMA